jgi:hypothetical protein
MEQLESAKAQLAEGAERVAAAVERTADELEGDGGEGLSGFGHSAATLMRQLAGGLRERDVEEFARELGALARRNPGVFLAGSVALGFGIARFFKARPPRGRPDGAWRGGDDWGGTGQWRGADEWPAGEQWGGSEQWRSGEQWRGASESGSSERDDYDADESLDLSAPSLDRRDEGEGIAAAGTAQAENAGRRDDERTRGRSRQSGKQKAKGQRASASGSEQRAADTGAPVTEEPAPAGSSEGTAATDSGTSRGDKS